MNFFAERVASAISIGFLCSLTVSTSAIASVCSDLNHEQPNLPIGHFQNPVFDTDFPDPGMVRAEDGYFYVYGTQTKLNGEDWEYIQVIRSRDLVHWERLPSALPALPEWGNQKANSWAPDVKRFGSKYVMYHTAESNETHSMGLAVAVADHPAGPFRDIGHPLQVGPGFEDIDPHAFVDDDGRAYLFWGSGFRPIRGRELTADGLGFKPGSEVVELVQTVQSPDGYERLHEAPWVIKHDGFYYMFYSGDDCFGHYEVRVARAKKPLGPWETKGQHFGIRSSAMLEPGDRWKAPGHNAIFQDDAGQHWILYHAIDKNNEFNPGQAETRRRPLLMDPIVWKNGWPEVESGHPSENSLRKPVLKKISESL